MGLLASGFVNQHMLLLSISLRTFTHTYVRCSMIHVGSGLGPSWASPSSDLGPANLLEPCSICVNQGQRMSEADQFAKLKKRERKGQARRRVTGERDHLAANDPCFVVCHGLAAASPEDSDDEEKDGGTGEEIKRKTLEEVRVKLSR